MSQNLEIEFKNLLTHEEYNRLIDFFDLTESDLFKQVNIYFDTKEHSLKKLGCALRVRIKENVYELTLKQPNSVGLMETSDYLNEDQFNAFVNTGLLHMGSVMRALQNLGVTECLNVTAELTTYRYETPYNIGLLVLDRSSYYDVIDHELEFEVQDYDEGKKAFHQLLNKFNIPLRKTTNKISRAYKQKLKFDSKTDA
ncbi:CYTH domain-containing protein [Haloplasma contractile]|uniref:RNA-thiamine triphosphatase protein n=1 Tax=Haloplasma contractile SSD-17B TaxID=1033810 RepID=U2FK02_9MOLU|nr:CYTH domain-containing protein [Haloplasma contractile]ERJ11559.1 RNA-thiamine triphosphatase protein [Haloplasma contractile SSD-17B]